MLKQTDGKIEFSRQKDKVKTSALYSQHLKLTSKSRMANFAGFLMPLWYSSIAEEHKAVRGTAGLFDCTHMGVLQISGEGSEEFLDTIATNNVGKLQVNQAQYSYILDAAGCVLDDIIIYKLEEDDFMVVVNAANEPKIKAYLNAVLQDEVIIDTGQPDRKVPAKPEVKDLRTQQENQGRVNIALQGPSSIDVLGCITDESSKEKISQLGSFRFTKAELAGVDCVVSRTGYTGAKVGFEIFPPPESVGSLWEKILEKGKSEGVVPCGLGARDSLRIEAGLPLYGHELDGEFNISPIEAGYGWAVKLDKDFFAGKSAMEKIKAGHTMKVVRAQFPGKKGIRPVRHKDPVLDSGGNCIGWVLSSAKAGGEQIALVFVDKEKTDKGEKLGVYYLARNKMQLKKGRQEKAEKGQKLEADLEGKVVGRFARF